jgi:C1A family cysteine protease
MNMKFTTILKCARVPSQSYSKLISAITQQPVSVAVDQNPDMILYKGGVYDGKCTSSLNHGMLLVGFGGKHVEDYFWRLKNTVGTTWGEAGYINIKRMESDGDGKCGIQLWPSVPQGIV